MAVGDGRCVVRDEGRGKRSAVCGGPATNLRLAQGCCAQVGGDGGVILQMAVLGTRGLVGRATRYHKVVRFGLQWRGGAW